MKAGTVVVLCLLFVIAMSCMNSEGLTSGQRMLRPSKNARGLGQLIPRTTNGPFYETYDVQCEGDRAIGNTIIQDVPTDMYSKHKTAKQFGYRFRFRTGGPTNKTYYTPKSAMQAYCADPNRVINAMPSY